MNQNDVWDRIFNKIELVEHHISKRYDKRSMGDDGWKIMDTYYENMTVLYKSNFYHIRKEESYEKRGLASIKRRKFEIDQSGRRGQIWGKKRHILKQFFNETIKKRENIKYI